MQLAYAGQPEAAIVEANKAIRLSPRDPELFHFFLAIGTASFVAGQYDEGAQWAKKVIREKSEVPSGHRLLAASYGQLGQTTEAKAALKDTLRIAPYLSVESAKNTIHFKNPADTERFIEGLCKAGLK
jgi:predicted Zn-dependent protease